MTAVDPFTAASATYRAATERPFKQGSAFEIGAPRHDIGRGLVLAAVAALIFAVLYCVISGAREDIYAATHPAVVATR